MLIVAFVGSLAAQARTTPATLDDLLAELRAVRADKAQSSSAVVRTQLLVRQEWRPMAPIPFGRISHSSADEPSRTSVSPFFILIQAISRPFLSR